MEFVAYSLCFWRTVSIKLEAIPLRLILLLSYCMGSLTRDGRHRVTEVRLPVVLLRFPCAGHSRNMQGMRLFVGAGPRGDASATPAAGAAAPRPPRPGDPAMTLKELVKRLRAVKSPAYTRWREQTLANREVSLPAP